ncbi:ATP-binding cassette domain-containing protein [Granulosicoccaceae sp. 1_MG-2023]|nr:ATP-binding cassette domain-containing protein [Granulosicoccaceae sp. 1_MG-2023]
MLEAENLSVRLGGRDYCFNLRVERGQCLAVLGESGAGKSTLLNLIGGFLQADGGQLRLDGREFGNLPPDRRPVTTLFQDNNLFAHLSVRDNLGLGLHPGLRLSKAQWQRVEAQLDAVGLSALGGRLPGELSGGQAQRVALARSLLREKPVLLLDEPFSALDEATRLDMLHLSAGVITTHRLCTVLVTHNRDDAERLGARCVYLRDGRLQAL